MYKLYLFFSSLIALFCACRKADTQTDQEAHLAEEARAEPPRSNEAALLAALAVDRSVGSELRAGALDVGVVSGVLNKTADHGTSRALLVEEVVGVLGLDEGLGLARERVGSDESSGEDGTAKVVVFAFGPDRGVLRLGELLERCSRWSI